MMMKSIISVLAAVLFFGSAVEGQVADNIILTYFFGPNQFINYNVNNFHNILNHASFVRTRTTVVYHYGFTQTPDSDVVQEVTHAYTQTNLVNYVLVNYPNVQVNVVTNANEIGRNLAAALNRVFDGGYSPALAHLVGFSLGAQIVGIAGRQIQTQSSQNYRVGRITGLDPGQISALLLPIIGRLVPTDATYVDTVHTEGNSFGDHDTRGHASFWVNGGGPQPMCNSIIGTIAATCSHNFACRVWAESVRARQLTFPSRICTTWAAFQAGQCNSNAVGNMGMTSSTALRGTYFLATNNNSPFSRPL